MSGGSGSGNLEPTVVEDWMRWSSIFDLWDTNGDGYVDMHELKSGVQFYLDMSGANYTMFEVRGILADMAVTDDERQSGLGRQSFGSFLSSLAQALGVPLEHLASSLADQGESRGTVSLSTRADIHEKQSEAWSKLPQLFERWDIDGDGVISRHELSLAVRKYRGKSAMRLTLADILALMDASDINGDKRMNKAELGVFLSRFSLASGIPISNIMDFFLEESIQPQSRIEATEKRSRRRSVMDQEAVAKGWQEMPLLFDIMDFDNSGTINRNELTRSMTLLIRDNGLDFTIQDCHKIMSEVDLNHDNQLDRREFGCFLSRFSLAADLSLDEVTYYLKKQSEQHQRKLNSRRSSEVQALEKGWVNMPKLFRQWDIDGDGHLNREEVAMGINQWRRSHKDTFKISLAECLQLMDEVDVDDNRVLDQMEFGAFLARISLATGVKLDELTDFLMKAYETETSPGGDRQSGEQTRGSARPRGQGFFGSMLARASIGFAEESNETQRRTNSTRRLQNY